MRMPRLLRAAQALSVGGVALLLFGCGGGQFGAELTARPKPLVLRAVEPQTIRLPQDQAFSIALPSATHRAGLGGTADAQGRAFPDGTAEASATVGQTGSANAEFQVGGAFSNDTDRQMDLAFRVTCRYEFAVSNQPERSLADASVGLQIYARVANGPMLRDIILLDQSTESGPAQGQSEAARDFTLTIGPGAGVTVWVAGRAQVNIPGERSGSAHLQVTGLTFNVATRPAPPVQIAPPEQTAPGAASSGAASPASAASQMPSTAPGAAGERR
jgi:hypothetical protein